MARKLVAVHFLHEYERAAARAAVKEIESGEAFVVGEADEATVAGLRAQGIIVEDIGELPEGPPAGAPSPALAAAVAALRPGPQQFSIKLTAHLLQTWRGEIEGRKGELVRRVSPREFIVRIEPSEALQLSMLPFVEEVRPLEVPRRKRAAEARPAPPLPAPPPPACGPRAAPPPPTFGPAPRAPPVAARSAAAPSPFTVKVVIAENAALADVTRWFSQRGDSVKAASGRKLRVELAGGEDDLEEVAATRDLVESAEEYVPPELFNDVAGGIVGARDPATGKRLLPFTGEGEIVAVADTGVDRDHPDLIGQVVGAVAHGRPAANGEPGRTDDPDGHGTHVAGTIAGTGRRSKGKYAGVAPGAKLFFQSLLDPQERLGGIPADLEQLFEEAYAAGARVHSDSWGAKVRARYTLDATEVDEFVARRRDMLIVIAAGNAAVASDPVYRPAGTVDLESMCSPATSKNALVVGASRSTRTSGGAAAETYGVRYSPLFPPPIGDEKISGKDNCLAAFSSRGYHGVDRVVKPDLVAPGTDVLSTRSRSAPLRKFWAACATSDHYAYLGGTSMAAPVVAGAAALVREYYRTVRQHLPTAALLKATLLNGTRWLDGPDALASGAEPPNSDQGFGCLDLRATLPGPAAPGLDLEFLDEDPARRFAGDNKSFKYDVVVEAGRPLRFCLAYTDAPGNQLQNDVNLVVEAPGARRKWLGNGRRSPIDVPIADRGNNVEVVRIEAPVPGKYLVRIDAYNILRRPQDFALVATGALASPFLPRP